MRHGEGDLFSKRSICPRNGMVSPGINIGTQHPKTAGTFYDSAVFREDQGKHQEAAFFYRRASAIREQTLGPAHPKTSATRERLRAVLHALSKTEAAQQLDNHG